MHYIDFISLFVHESHPREASSTNTNHMWRFQGPDKLTGLLIICVSRERNVIHRHLQRKFLPWHGCDLFRFRHDMLGKKKRVSLTKKQNKTKKKLGVSYRHCKSKALHFKYQWNVTNGQIRCEEWKNLQFHKMHAPKQKHSMHNTHGQWIREFVLLPDTSQYNLHWNYNTCVWLLALKAKLDTSVAHSC